MPISLSLTPRPLHLSRNQVAVEITTTDKYTTVGVAAIRQLRFSTYPLNADDELNIAWERDGVEKSAAFLFKVSPDAGEYELPIYPGSDPLGWLATVVAGLEGHPDLAEDWIMNGEFFDPTYGIRFRARYQEDDSLAITVDGYTKTEVQVAVGATPVAQDNYRLSAWLHVGLASESGNSGFTRLPEVELDVNISSMARMDLQRYLEDMLDAHEPPTATGGGVPVLCTLINRPAYLLLGQKWGDPIERKKQLKSATFRVLKCGLRPEAYPGIRDSLTANMQARWLTNRLYRRIRRDQLDWLFWLAKPEPVGRDYRIGIKAYRANGTTGNNSIALATVLDSRTYQFRTDFSALSISAFEGVSPVIRYEVSIRDFAEDDQVGVAVTDTIIYDVVDNDYLDIVFEFENSLGGIESFLMRGARELVHQLTKDGYTTPLPFEYGASDKQLQSYGERSFPIMTCGTGPLRPDEALGYVDFLHSRHRWLIADGIKIPARVLNAEALAERFELEGNYVRGGEFSVELGVTKSIS